MSSSCRLTLLLALAVAAAAAAPAQSSTTSANPAAPASEQDQSPAPRHHGLKRLEPHVSLHRAPRHAGPVESSAPAPRSSSEPPAPGQDQAAAPQQDSMSVQARIRARREQRRAAAIHDAYAHTYEAYVGMGYLRFIPGPGTAAIPATITTPAVPHGPQLEHVHEYAWNVGVTRYFSERLGLTVEGRGYFGTAYVYNNGISNSFITNPAISQYAAIAGPTYRFYVQPKFSISGRVLGGMTYGNFSGDLGSYHTYDFGLWPDGYTFAASVSIPFEYNLTPHVGVRVAPEYYFTGFGSTMQYTKGFTTGVVYRFGKQ